MSHLTYCAHESHHVAERSVQQRQFIDFFVAIYHIFLFKMF